MTIKSECRNRILSPQAALVICALALNPGTIPVALAAPDPAAGGSEAKEAQGNRAGFSIESEMLTYRALESNSEAVACDVAAYVNGSVANFSAPPPGAVCAVKKGGQGAAGVLIAPFDRTLFDNYQIWRVEMELMRQLQEQADLLCPDSAVLASEARGAGGGASAHAAGSAAAAAETGPNLGPAGAAWQIASSLLGMIAVVPNNTPVTGTIQDQAFIDGVARELRSLDVAVLIPFTYGPYSLSPSDVARSPFLTAIHRLVVARVCLQEKRAEHGLSSAQLQSIGNLISDIDAYISSFRGVLPRKSDGTSEAGSTAPSKRATGGAQPEPKATTVPAPSAQSALQAVLNGDDLARMLGVDPSTGLLPPDGPWRHVLLLKALESGGTVEHKGNIFGTTIRYSGGSVGTYALFSLEGHLECSGNVYEFGGSLPADTFQRDLRNYTPNPQSQFIFQRGSCGTGLTR
jgi:hypothetical protein